MTGARLRGVAVLALLSLNALVVLAWSQEWLVARADRTTLSVPGSAAGGAELPLALTGFALVAAILIAGRVFRVILAVLQALLGACVAIAAGLVLADPADAARAQAARQTGIAGDAVDVVAAPTAWPVVALVLGVTLVLAGIGVAATVRRWPRATSRFERSRAAAAERGGPVAPDPIEEWDALSGGEDPTRPAG